MAQNKAVFLDRDGVINHDTGYTSKIEDFEFIDGVFQACKRFIFQGYQIVVVTNQSGIARGFYSEDDFFKLTNWMIGQFDKHGIEIERVYFCPHHPTAGHGKYLKDCDCRKPNPGMLLRAARELDLDLSASIMIGDNLTDMQAGEKAGCKECILVNERVLSPTLTQGYRTFPRLSDVTLGFH
ncbi:D-glycero-beta-D-manno-heptose 1,7-bisphosphate 7-phosphatase [Alteromonas sp. a30]|uniref:D-glycero-beta-D-manno-heptose 1,7-bisphosphate 7-phosphatase n=1 Tax=Alteromonas sp. a30 TaxID=2730917 RepID=UPI0022811FF0|nr:D-glycero-beta-D-manno-heptose 1,7-bisphosphate 7-phosphatase [Alteromonas sp. a30]MCY7294164.1 D-glycero-beta-D-manno-heptose 1,7-bisphosphate 7-phosphatase [Alteromonas sp. a30]